MLKKDSANGRALIWKVSATIIKENPLFGIGFNKFESDYLNYQEQYFASGKGTAQEEYLADNIHWAFNEFILITAEFGIVGLVLFLLWIALTLQGLRKNIKSRFYRTVLASLITFLCFACFSYPFYSSPHTVMFVVIMALLSSYNTKTLLV